MSDKVLEAVGRRHTARQTVEAYEQAVKAGFDDINMDLIADCLRMMRRALPILSGRCWI